MQNHDTRLNRMLPRCLLSLALVLCAGCGGHGAQSLLARQTGPQPVTGAEHIAAAADRDGDGIADEIETALGTDPARIDSDGDGLTDQYELWGCRSIPIGQRGPLAGLPDPNGNGVIAALDPGDAADTARSKSATDALQRTRIRVVAPGPNAEPIENDLDGDFIPSDFELAGFYYEIDPLTGEDWFVKWDGDYSRNYYKTDPTKWSSDADPWSDWEEATKRNMDQRVKKPGDHPCIPAYPDIQAVLVSYTVEDASKISAENGKEAKSEWTNSVSTKDEAETSWGWNAGVEIEQENKWSTNVFGLPEFSATLSVTAKGGYHFGSKTTNSSTTSNDTSGLNAEEWKAVTAGDTINTAKLLLNLKLINVGTLPASDAKILFNLKLGDFVIDSFLVALDSFQGFGELEALAGNAIDYAVIDNGRRTEYVEPKPLYLSLEQLKTLHLGAPLSIELVSFEARTIVSEVDPATGRRINLDIGPWSPYQSALENTSARLLLDVGEPDNPEPVLPGQIAPRNTKEVRIFAYDHTGSYIGSPPSVTLMDGFVWGFGARADGMGPTVTFTDPITRKQRSAFLADFLFGFDKSTTNRIFNEPQYRNHLFALPLEPSNPSERVYVAEAPPLVRPGAGIDRRKPSVLWAQLRPYEKQRVEVKKPMQRPEPGDPAYALYDPDNPPLVFDRYAYQPVFNPLVQAAVTDVTGLSEVRFVPSPGQIGERMQLADPDTPQAGGLYQYSVPLHYQWTGFESVVAYNLDGQASAPVFITIDQGSHLDASGALVVGSNRDALLYGRYTVQSDPPIPDSTHLIDVARDFVAAGVAPGHIIRKLDSDAQCTVVSVLSPTKLEVGSWVANGTAQPQFNYGDAYAIMLPSHEYSLLGYEEASGLNTLEVYEKVPGAPSFGMQFSNTSQIKSAPFDIRVEQKTSAPASLTIKCDQALGIGIVGVGNYASWTYTVLRKTPLSSADLAYWNEGDGPVEDFIFAARLQDGRLVKFRFNYETYGGHQVVSSVDYAIYRGI